VRAGVSRMGHMMGDWTFFSNHGHVLVCLASNREARLRDVAYKVGITERAVQKIVRDLQDEGFLTVSKQGRCNRYRINRRKSLRHDLESHCTVGKLLALVTRAGSQQSSAAEALKTAPDAIKSEVAPGEGPTPEEPEAAKQPSPADVRQQGSLF
jgi:predicted ArsR family transcriptional regulator